MSPVNGALVVGVPLFRLQHSEVMGAMEGYNIFLSNNKPLAYVIDFGESAQVLSFEFVEGKLINLGDL